MEIEIMTAAEARETIDKNMTEYKKRLKNESYAALPCILQIISKDIEKAVANKENFLYYPIWRYGKNIADLEDESFEYILPTLKVIFEGLGYKFYYDGYSQSWTYQSGKKGYFTISW